jgi:hypothetical protein
VRSWLLWDRCPGAIDIHKDVLGAGGQKFSSQFFTHAERLRSIAFDTQANHFAAVWTRYHSLYAQDRTCDLRVHSDRHLTASA